VGSKPHEFRTQSADLPTRSENAISILVGNVSSADDLQLPLGMEALRADATEFDNLESDRDIASRNPTNNMHDAWNPAESNTTLTVLVVGS
jgi:hypothetical protein